MARHLLYTRRYLQERFQLRADDVQIDYEPDTFGHSRFVPEILAQGGVKYYYRTFSVSADDSYTMNIIFDQGSSNGQTVDITGINSDRYFEIASTTNKFTVRDITGTVDIPGLLAPWQAPVFYDLSGRPVHKHHRGIVLRRNSKQIR